MRDINAEVKPWSMLRVIPALPLALTDERKFDVGSQRSLVRYYLDSCVDGIAVGVHTTQLELHTTHRALYRKLLTLVADEVSDYTSIRPCAPRLIAGVFGEGAELSEEAELAASLGYHALMPIPILCGEDFESRLLRRSEQLAAHLPLFGFYLQPAAGGRYLSPEYWSSLANQPGTVAVKLAPFNRYWTLEAAKAILSSDRSGSISLLTGNDDNIIGDLLTPIFVDGKKHHFSGALLGQFAISARIAVNLLSRLSDAQAGDASALKSLIDLASSLTDINSAIFDARNQFRGVIIGVHEVLRSQGILSSNALLDPAVVLSSGQRFELHRVRETYSSLFDDDFIKENLQRWSE